MKTYRWHRFPTTDPGLDRVEIVEEDTGLALQVNVDKAFTGADVRTLVNDAISDRRRNLGSEP